MRTRPAHLSRGALVVPAILVALGIFLLYGTLTMEVVGDGGLFGPTTMPWIVAVLCFVVAAGLTFDILRPRPEYDGVAAGAVPAAVPAGGAAAGGADDAAAATGHTGVDPGSPDGVGPDGVGPDGAGSGSEASGDAVADAPDAVNSAAVLTAVGGVAAFIVVLPWLGWILAATGLFTALAAALGNRRWFPVVLAGLALASAIQVVFSGLLGISLPAGFVGGF
ncbi:putative tricarboxylic transport membrane protein [Pseudonocardia ammonioxydans]|uniref:Putative tricarboxylic transport membrane protein n=1 Tax=Pseudonocardia ammonioxydans TaxID=260086 RepID=A0A1I4UGL5_PSUAM|nr:tripartite tricarboxylate transporter TctB family protein [Pseudonocardia ammonioxydans]SFM87930.1 putative tricarboxylic transport membrane protein [Pseudonocardia ammonioxydans]